MGRIYTRVHRLMRLVSAIQSRRDLNVDDLCRLCEVHERTIYRDLATLNASGVPCDFDPVAGGYRIAPGFFLPPVELTFEEALAVVALLEEAGDGRQIPFLGAAARAAEKLRSQLDAAVVDGLDTVADHLRIDLARAAGDDACRDVYDDVRDAIARRRVLICTYDAAAGIGSDDEPFEFRPYALWWCQRAWYTVGHHGGRAAVRRLKLNRFTSAQITDRPFHIPEDFDLRADLGNAWRMIRGDTRYHIAIHFTPAFADAASETRWHPTQADEWHEDGSVTLTFDVDGLGEIVWFVLGYGPGAKVLEPPELIERVRMLLTQAADAYA